MDNSFEIRKSLEYIVKEIISEMNNPWMMDGTIVGYETIDGVEYPVFQPTDTELTSIAGLDLPRNPNTGEIVEKPVVGTKAVANLSTNSGGVLSNFNAVEKIVLAPGDEDHGGVIIVQQCVDKLNEIIDKINEIDNWAEGHKANYNTHIHNDSSTLVPTTTPLVPYLAPKPIPLGQVTVPDLENPVVRHGNGVAANAQQTTNAEIEAAKNAYNQQNAKVIKLNERIAELTKKIDRLGSFDAAATNIALNEKVTLMNQVVKEEKLLNQALDKLNAAMAKGASSKN
jgi:hypothetical protein